MAALDRDIILWAVPRFRRQVRPRACEWHGRGAAETAVGALNASLLKTVADGVAENPDGAADVYSGHM